MYSQHSEDRKIIKYLVDKKIMLTPHIVDAGCGDFVTGSNSKALNEIYKYTILGIDANQDIVPAELPEGVKFINAMLDNSVYNAEMAEVIKGDWQTKTVIKSKTAKTKTKKLSTILNKEGKDIGILMLDLEGKDTNVILEVLQNAKVKIQSILIEANSQEDFISQKELIETAGYIEVFRENVNTFYILKDLYK